MVIAGGKLQGESVEPMAHVFWETGARLFRMSGSASGASQSCKACRRRVASSKHPHQAFRRYSRDRDHVPRSWKLLGGGFVFCLQFFGRSPNPYRPSKNESPTKTERQLRSTNSNNKHIISTIINIIIIIVIIIATIYFSGLQAGDTLRFSDLLVVGPACGSEPRRAFRGEYLGSWGLVSGSIWEWGLGTWSPCICGAFFLVCFWGIRLES